MQYFRKHAVTDCFSGDFGDRGEWLLLVHGHVAPAHAALLNKKLQRVAQDFVQQHRANQRLPDNEIQAYTVLIGMRSWRFGAFRQLLRQTH